jgi:hypothetical protein
VLECARPFFEAALTAGLPRIRGAQIAARFHADAPAEPQACCLVFDE